jgi:hypothetical protein
MADRPKTPAARAAEGIIETLEGRGGFDHWWGGIARVDQREIADAITGIIEAGHVPAAVPAAPLRPKLEIIRPDDESVEIYVDGKEIASANHDADGWNGMGRLVDAAQAIARALGADIVVADDPAPQPYRYYVTFMIAMKRNGGFDYMPAVRWLDLPRAIEGPEDTDRLCAEFAAAHRDYPAENIRITSFIYIEGPS